MILNMVIVDNNVERGVETGKSIADHLTATLRYPWKLSVHVRHNLNRTTDDNFKRYEG